MKTIFGTLFVLLPVMFFTRADAQSTVIYVPINVGQPTPQCDIEVGMASCIDWVDAASGIVAGWSVNRYTGHQPPAIQLWALNGTLTFVGNANILVARPDVAAAFGTCDPNVGFGVSVGQALPPGQYELIITDAPYTVSNTIAFRVQ